MTDFTPYTQLKRIVSYCLDECNQSMNSFDKYWVLAFRALIDCFYDISGEPLTVRLPVQGNKTVIFPADCISPTKIGVLDSGGQISTLKINNALTTYRDTNPNRLSQLTSEINDNLSLLANSPVFVNYFYNDDYQILFGTGSGLVQYGECKIDEENRVVILHPEFQYDSVMFEYLSSPEKNGDYQVPTALQEAIIAFIKWKAKQGPEIDYYNRKIEARRRMPKKKVMLQNIAQVIRQDTGFYMHT